MRRTASVLASLLVATACGGDGGPPAKKPATFHSPSGTVTALARIKAGTKPCAVLARDDAVWVTLWTEGTVIRIDPRTTDVLRLDPNAI